MARRAQEYIAPEADLHVSVFMVTDHICSRTTPISEWAGSEEYDAVTESLEYDSGSDDVFHHLTHPMYEGRRTYEGRNTAQHFAY